MTNASSQLKIAQRKGDSARFAACHHTRSFPCSAAQRGNAELTANITGDSLFGTSAGIYEWERKGERYQREELEKVLRAAQIGISRGGASVAVYSDGGNLIIGAATEVDMHGNTSTIKLQEIDGAGKGFNITNTSMTLNLDNPDVYRIIVAPSRPSLPSAPRYK